jgi:integrase
MLINCPECGHQVSDKALLCPQCGFPFSDTPQEKPAVSVKAPKKNRRMKLPNGFGSIKKFSGSRRRPYVAFPPTKKDEFSIDGIPPTKKSLGSFATYQEAYDCLLEFNKLPYNEKYARATFAEIYDKYTDTPAYNNLRNSTRESRKAAFKYCADLHDVPVRKISKAMCEDVLAKVDHGTATRKNVLTCMHTVAITALDMNLIPKDFTSNITIVPSDPTYERIPFSKGEINRLWKMSGRWDVQIFLILLYSGMRVNEFLKNDLKNVNLDERWIYVPKELAKNKTSVRYVPIHDRIVPLVQHFVDNANRFGKDKIAINDSGALVAYNNFATRNVVRINKELGTTHRLHDTRHTFATQGTLDGIDEVYMQKILGHAPQSMLYSTYTHIGHKELLEKINRLCY